MTAILICLLIGVTIIDVLLLVATALLAGMALKIYTEMAKERAYQIRANLAAMGINADDHAKPLGRDTIS